MQQEDGLRQKPSGPAAQGSAVGKPSGKRHGRSPKGASLRPAARKRSRGRRAWLAAACATIAAAMYLWGGAWEYHGATQAAAQIAASRERLEAMQRETPVDMDAELKRQRREALSARGGILVDDMEAERQKILAMTNDDWSRIEFARWFSGTAIVGDSIIEQARSYHYLEAPIFCKKGISVSPDLSLLDEVEAANPSVIFLCFGMNDVESFKSQVDIYVERYSAIIRRLHDSLPDAVIYVQATLPVTEKCLANIPECKYIDLYNSEMEKACPELDAYFIDPGFILRAKPELYSPDGQHPTNKYYPMWLTFLADCAGLNHD